MLAIGVVLNEITFQNVIAVVAFPIFLSFLIVAGGLAFAQTANVSGGVEPSVTGVVLG